jgi:hypothetical protein
MSPATTFDEHVVVSLAKRRRFDPRALNALLKARELLALSLGLLLATVRIPDPEPQRCRPGASRRSDQPMYG